MKLFYFIIVFFSVTTLISAQQISVEPGFFKAKYFQDNDKLTKENFESILANNKVAFDYWNRGKKQESLWWTFAAVEGGFAIWFFSVNGNSDKMIAPAAGTIGSFAIASVFFFKSINSKKKAILTYNKQFDNKTTYRLVPVSNQNGLGLALRF